MNAIFYHPPNLPNPPNPALSNVRLWKDRQMRLRVKHEIKRHNRKPEQRERLAGMLRALSSGTVQSYSGISILKTPY